MDGATLTDVGIADQDFPLSPKDMVIDDELFRSLLSGDLDSLAAEMSPLQLLADVASPIAVLAYGVRNGSAGSGGLELVQAAEAIIGQRVDFSG